MADCRFCRTELHTVVIDLGASPLANSYLTSKQLAKMEPYYPLKVFFCHRCGLVQLEEFVVPDRIFGDYDYFSSYSDFMLAHAEKYVLYMINDFGIDSSRQVVEVASNDGYLLQYFVNHSIPALGVEPAANVARTAIDKGVPTEVAFFGLETALRLHSQGKAADLLLGNNVLAHVPDVNDFVAGMACLLKPEGIKTKGNPQHLNMNRDAQIFSIFHEHFSYFSLRTVESIFAAHRLRVFRVEKVPTHGGSLRVFACHADANRSREAEVDALLAEELSAGLNDTAGYAGFAEAAQKIKFSFLEFLLAARCRGDKVAAYGAAAKGNTLLNYAGVKPDLLPMMADRSPHKQGKFLTGSRIPVVTPEALLEYRPDYVIILAWNLREEVSRSLAEIRDWGGRFVCFIPEMFCY